MMINMIEKNSIISIHIHEHKSKREISRILGISRNTVDKYISEYEKNLKALKESEHDYESRVHQQTLIFWRLCRRSPQPLVQMRSHQS